MPYPNEQQPQQGAQPAAPYNPFDPMNLYVPMNRDIDQSNAAQAAQLREQFGAKGGRWSSGLIGGLGTLNRNTAADKAKLMSQLQYQGAQDMYGRQKDSANMNMQLGSLQDQRDQSMTGQAWGMGQGEENSANQDLQAHMQEWLRTNQGYLPQLLQLLNAGNQGDSIRDPGFWEKYGPIIGKVLGEGANYDWGSLGNDSSGG